MGGALEAVELRTLDCLTARTENQIEELVSHFNDFDARKATCSIAEENDRLLSIIEGANGGFEVFNETLGKAMVLLAHREHARKTQHHSTDWSTRSVPQKNSTAPRISPSIVRFSPAAVSVANSATGSSSGSNLKSSQPEFDAACGSSQYLASSLATGDTAVTAHSRSHTWGIGRRPQEASRSHH
ncbi:hypothetical protein T492DRAFT_177926 [Pavlovales sp. CCMP2436]|nr:hypothetical protein T492DRAFT_177926 [Pavlovales sp. CCMP2436]